MCFDILKLLSFFFFSSFLFSCGGCWYIQVREKAVPGEEVRRLLLQAHTLPCEEAR